MPKLKKEFFSRGVRFQHRFGDKDDPWVMPEQYFEMPSTPDGIKSVNMNGKGRFRGQQYGLHVHTPPQSSISKARGGHANIGGEKADAADTLAEAIPPSSKERRTTGPIATPVTEAKPSKRKG